MKRKPVRKMKTWWAVVLSAPVNLAFAVAIWLTDRPASAYLAVAGLAWAALSWSLVAAFLVCDRREDRRFWPYCDDPFARRWARRQHRRSRRKARWEAQDRRAEIRDARRRSNRKAAREWKAGRIWG